MQCENCKNERPEYRKRTWTEEAPRKRNNEDLLTYYLRLQYAKKRCLRANQNTDYFPLLRSDSIIRDMEVLQEFIKKYEPRGARFIKEEVVIISED